MRGEDVDKSPYIIYGCPFGDERFPDFVTYVSQSKLLLLWNDSNMVRQFLKRGPTVFGELAKRNSLLILNWFCTSGAINIKYEPVIEQSDWFMKVSLQNHRWQNTAP